MEKRFKSKKYVLARARNIVEKNKAFFNLENEKIKVIYDKNTINNGFITMSLINRSNFKLGVSKVEDRYFEYAFKILVGHELSHGKFFKNQSNSEYFKQIREGFLMFLGFGELLGKEAIIKRIILEILCDINAIKRMNSNIDEIEVYFERDKVFEDKIYLLSGYFPPRERKIIVEKYSFESEINPVSFSNDFLKLYNNILDGCKKYNLKLDSIDLILKIINEEYKEEFLNNNSMNLGKFKIFRV